MTLSLNSAPQSLCILRLSAIGDITHMVPVVRTLQQQWPSCKITWIIGNLEATLVGDIPGVEFITFNKSEGLKSLQRLRHQLQKRKFDLLLNMQVAMRSSIISLFIKAPIKLGFDRARAHDFQWLFTNHKIDSKPEQHVLDGFFGFLEKLDIQQRQMSWDIPIPYDAAHYIEQLLSTERPVLQINPCSSSRIRNWRNWPAERYAAIIDYASKQHQLQTVLTGGPDDNEIKMATDICELSTSNIINLVGQTSLKQLLALSKRAIAVIAPDTGPAHIATAVDTPVIGLFATSNPKRTGPYLSQRWLINRYPDAAKEFLGKSESDLAWGQRIRNSYAMQLITLDDVKDKLDFLLQESDKIQTSHLKK